MNLIRPNGLIERLPPIPRREVELNGYGRAQPAPATAQSLRLAALHERRRQLRRKPDPLRGRLIDLTA
jgi:hypothetical protein